MGDRSAEIMKYTYSDTCTWQNGACRVELVRTGDRPLVIRNLGEVGRTKVEILTATTEEECVFPLLGGDVQAWSAKESAHIIGPHEKENFSEPTFLQKLKRMPPLTFEFLSESSSTNQGSPAFVSVDPTLHPQL
jgi:hypothetical protein